MKGVPGTLQEGGAAFASTHWSIVLLAAQSQSPEAARQATAAFCQDYWPPLYTFLRRRGHPPGDAQDFTQAFFVHLLTKNTLERADRNKGRLRTFLLGALQHFLANEHDRAQTLKRGGGQQFVPLDEHFAEAEESVAASDGPGGESAAYDRHWAATLIESVWERLHTELAAEGKERWLEELRPYLIGGETSLNQEQSAARLGVPVGTLRTALHRLRLRYRQTLRAEVARTVDGEAEIDEELRYLYGVLAA